MASTAPEVSSAETIPVLVDCDPGHDDAIALLLAAAEPRLRLIGVTTVAGNQTLSKTTLNARRICTVGDITGVPIAAGADGPLSRSLQVAEDIHGQSGLDGPVFAEPTVPLSDEHAVTLMSRLLTSSVDPVTLVPLGPLTNVAMLLQQHPDAAERVAEIVLMGGSTGRGNASPYAEFNIWADPEAAALVFGSGLPVRMVGLNVTHQVRVTDEVVARLHNLQTPLAHICVELMTFYAESYRKSFGFSHPPLHDPLAVAAVAVPELLEWVEAPVAIETVGTHTAGATVVDLHAVTGATANACVAVGVDAEGFFERVLSAIGALGGRSSSTDVRSSAPVSTSG